MNNAGVKKSSTPFSSYLLALFFFVVVPSAAAKRLFMMMDLDVTERDKSWSMDIGGLALPQLTLLIVSGVNLFLFLVLEFTMRITPDPRDWQAPDASAKRINPIDWTFQQVYILSRNFACFSVILFYAYICETHPPNEHGE
jgi:hypothetical protein